MAKNLSLATRTIIFIWITLISLSLSKQETAPQQYQIEQLDINSDEAKLAAAFAVRELSKLSDSGIYTTINLKRLVSAEYQIGVYHENTILNLELSSPYFKSGKTTESFEIVVMKHLEDGVRSFAINEFPEMNEDAIEEFYIRKVEARRRKREESFRRLEFAAFKSLQNADKSSENHTNDSYYDCMQKDEDDVISADEVDKEAVTLLSRLDNPERRASRQQASRDRIKENRVHDFAVNDEERVASLSLDDLHRIVLGDQEASDYQVQRARELLDDALKNL
eukprot:gene24306-32742_t